MCRSRLSLAGRPESGLSMNRRGTKNQARRRERRQSMLAAGLLALFILCAGAARAGEVTGEPPNPSTGPTFPNPQPPNPPAPAPSPPTTPPAPSPPPSPPPPGSMP